MEQDYYAREVTPRRTWANSLPYSSLELAHKVEMSLQEKWTSIPILNSYEVVQIFIPGESQAITTLPDELTLFGRKHGEVQV